MKQSAARLAHGAKTVFLRLLSPFRESYYTGFLEDKDGRAQGRRNILWQNICANIIAVLTNGIFLTGLVLIILEDESEAVRNQYLGLIVSLQLLANTCQLFSPLVTSRLRTCRPLVFASRLIYYTTNVALLGLVPLLPFSAIVNANIFMVLIFVQQIVYTLPNPALSIWHISNIPDQKRADFFSIQQMVIPIVNALVSLGASFVIDRFEMRGAQLTGMLVIRGITMLVVALELRTHFKIKEPVREVQTKKIRLTDAFVASFRYKGFLLMCLISCLWNMIAQFPGQYFNAYLLENLELSYTFINLCASTSIPLMLLALPVWNRIVRKLGWLKTLGIAYSLYTLPYLFNCLMFKETVALYFISVVYCNMIGPGINLCFSNLPYLKMPEHDQDSCMAFYCASAGLAAFLGAYLGRFFIHLTEGKILRIGSLTIVNKQYICLISLGLLILTAILVLCTAHRDRLKEKAAE